MLNSVFSGFNWIQFIKDRGGMFVGQMNEQLRTYM